MEPHATDDRRIEALAVHDASFEKLDFDWATKALELDLILVGGKSGQLRFNSVTEHSMTARQPWGPSRSINSVRQTAANTFEIELQSGDTLRVHAMGWEFRIEGAQ